MEAKEIRKKSFYGFLALIIMLAISIFLPAWSLNYMKGWIFLIIFLTFVLFIIIYFLNKDPELIERRIHGGPKAEKEKSQKRIQVSIRFFYPAIFVISGFDYRFNWSNVPTLLYVTAIIFLIYGFIIIFYVFKENTYASSVITVHEEQKVISTGLYGVVRNPMYLGIVIIVLSAPITLGSYWALVPGIGICITFVIRLLKEEKFLINNLDGYIEYCERVRYKLIPGLW